MSFLSYFSLYLFLFLSFLLSAPHRAFANYYLLSIFRIFFCYSYGHEVDWWAIGTLLFEMMTGLPPFYNEDTQEMYRRILFQPLHCPDSISPKGRDIITGLLQRNPKARLGHNGSEEIKDHVFFDCINWDDLAEKKVPAPWKPTVRDEMDTSNFDEDFTSQVPVDTPVRAARLTRSLQRKFTNFTFVDQSELDGKF